MTPLVEKSRLGNLLCPIHPIFAPKTICMKSCLCRWDGLLAWARWPMWCETYFLGIWILVEVMKAHCFTIKTKTLLMNIYVWIHDNLKIFLFLSILLIKIPGHCLNFEHIQKKWETSFSFDFLYIIYFEISVNVMCWIFYGWKCWYTSRISINLNHYLF